MNFFSRVTIALTSMAIAFLPLDIAVAKDIEDIADLAREITVKISQTGGVANGSGVIFDRDKDEGIYFVVTNNHVIEPGYNYSIQAPDGERYPLTVDEEIVGLDLAIVTFRSDKDYKIANLGRSEKATQLETVYVAGFPGRQDNMDLIDGKIRRIDEQIYENPQTNEGYAWEYSNETFPGSSGGAVLNDDGRLIGINGQSEVTMGGIEIRRGIPIHFLTSYLQELPEESESEQSESEEPEESEIIGMLPSNIVATELLDDNAVTTVAVSDDSAIAVSGGLNEDIKVWNLSTNVLERSLEGHEAGINSVAISPDNLSIMSGSEDETIKIWNWQTWELKKTLEGHEDIVNQAVWNSDGSIVVSGSNDKTVRIWNASTGQLERTFDGHDEGVSSVAISADGDTVVSGSWDKSIKVWKWRSWELQQTLYGHDDVIGSVAISPDGQTIVSSSDDATIKLWDLATGNVKQTLRGHLDLINTIAISGDGSTLVSGSNDLTIKVWDIATGSLRHSLEGHEDSINSIDVSYDGRTIVSGSEDRTVKLWRL